jgi:GNAT superfamily N-acetyltransferase
MAGNPLAVPWPVGKASAMGLEVVAAAARPDLESEATAAFRQRWPEFIFHDPTPPKYMDRVHQYFSEYDVLLLLDGHVAAGGWGVPIAWDRTPGGLPEGYDAALIGAVEDHEEGRVPNTLSLMAAAVHPNYDKQGLATDVLAALTERAVQAGIEHVVAPIRPTWKQRYPQVSMAEYATWSREDGLSIDPWIRTHQRMGAQILRPAPNSMVISGTVAEWETWSGMLFPVSGDYVVPEALNLLQVNRENDTAIYCEENLWVQHR